MRFRALFLSFQPAITTARQLGWRLLFLLLLIPAPVAADSKLSEDQRQQIIRVFLAEHPFIHRTLPRGKTGVRIEGSKITPSEGEINQLVAQFGPAAKPGDRAHITAVRFVRGGIVFELNGGPAKRKKWSQRINVGINGVDPSKTQQTDDNVYTNANGSFVLLAVKDDVSSLTTDQIKDLLAPVLDFKAATVAEAYQKSLPPVLAEAVKNHHALVGMDKEMVTCALGRPPRRIRETKDGQELEEWIYGAPPKDVEFIRFLGERVIQIEDMNVTGEKQLRTQNEIGNLDATLTASEPRRTRPDSVSSPSGDDDRSAPTLLRPGESSPATHDAGRNPRPTTAPDATSTPTDSPTPTRSPIPGTGPI
jgi:hypothetical protein